MKLARLFPQRGEELQSKVNESWCLLSVKQAVDSRELAMTMADRLSDHVDRLEANFNRQLMPFRERIDRESEAQDAQQSDAHGNLFRVEIRYDPRVGDPVIKHLRGQLWSHERWFDTGAIANHVVQTEDDKAVLSLEANLRKRELDDWREEDTDLKTRASRLQEIADDVDKLSACRWRDSAAGPEALTVFWTRSLERKTGELGRDIQGLVEESQAEASRGGDAAGLYGSAFPDEAKSVLDELAELRPPLRVHDWHNDLLAIDKRVDVLKDSLPGPSFSLAAWKHVATNYMLRRQGDQQAAVVTRSAEYPDAEL